MIPSRYFRPSRTHLPREKKTISLIGSGDDAGRYFKCWNCGFTCDKDINALEHGRQGRGGATTESYTDTDGVTKYKSLVTKGCAFCGSTNWK